MVFSINPLCGYTIKTARPPCIVNSPLVKSLNDSSPSLCAIVHVPELVSAIRSPWSGSIVKYPAAAGSESDTTPENSRELSVSLMIKEKAFIRAWNLFFHYYRIRAKKRNKNCPQAEISNKKPILTTLIRCGGSTTSRRGHQRRNQKSSQERMLERKKRKRYLTPLSTDTVIHAPFHTKHLFFN